MPAKAPRQQYACICPGSWCQSYHAPQGCAQAGQALGGQCPLSPLSTLICRQHIQVSLQLPHTGGDVLRGRSAQQAKQAGCLPLLLLQSAAATPAAGTDHARLARTVLPSQFACLPKHCRLASTPAHLQLIAYLHCQPDAAIIACIAVQHLQLPLPFTLYAELDTQPTERPNQR